MSARAVERPRVGFGKRIAVLVIDLTRGGVEDRWSPNSSTRHLMQPISELLTAARARGVPVFYTRGGLGSMTARSAPVTATERGNWVWKTPLNDDRGTTAEEMLASQDIPPEIKPAAHDVVITKNKPSGFFQSPLQSFLNFHQIDTVIVCGSATNSGVLYTVNDAFSYNYRVVVPIECVASRTLKYHDISLEMMDRVVADVMPLREVLAYLNHMDAQEPAISLAGPPPKEAATRDVDEQQRMGFGERLAVLVIDMHRHQVDPQAPLSYDAARRAVAQIARLLGMARAKNLPVFYTTGGLRSLIAEHYPATMTERGSWLYKNQLTSELGASTEALERAFGVPDQIAPQAEDTVIRKYKPSGFFESPLQSFLTLHRIDTLVACGSSTQSGVLMTVNDAFSYNYRVIVPRECCVSRDPRVHKLALAMVGQRHADIMDLDEVLDELRGRPVQEPA